MPPSIRGFKVEQILDNTLYLVCVVTRGSSWRGSSTFGSSVPDFKTEPLMMDLNDDENDDDIEYDIDALESLGLIRTERETDVTDDDEEIRDGNEKSMFNSMKDWIMYGEQDMSSYNSSIDVSIYPSSNDTHLMVTKPMLVNLGSKSSKCTEIKTPVDPTKMRFIDNKRMSIIIGCTAGILVFIFIIIREKLTLHLKI